jgi:hypothetical protein
MLHARVVYTSIRGATVAEVAIDVNGVIINNLATNPAMKKAIFRVKCSELTTMVMESSTKEVWISLYPVG